jgi:hypothetical protein
MRGFYFERETSREKVVEKKCFECPQLAVAPSSSNMCSVLAGSGFCNKGYLIRGPHERF